ncbi:MAG: tetratricopeptide repeat protein [Salibacteraceae bacterium]
MYRKHFTTLLLTVISLGAFAEKEQGFYLMDSISEQSLSVRDLGIVDSILTLYHKAESDSSKLELLDFISSYCSDDVALAYTNFIHHYVKDILKDSAQYSESLVKFFIGSYANSMVNQGYFVRQKGDVDSALVLYEKGYKMFEKAGDKLGMVNTVNNIAVAYVTQNKVEKGMEMYFKNLPLYKELGDDKGLMVTYINIAETCQIQGKIEEALDYAKKSLIICDTAGYEHEKIIVLNTLGRLYMIQEEENEAFKVYQQSLALAQKLDNKRAIAQGFDHLGNYYQLTGRFQESIECDLKSVSIRKEMNDQQGLAYTLNNLAVSHLSLGETDKALYYHQQSLTLRRTLNDSLGIAFSTHNLGSLHFDLKDWQKAQAYGEESLEISQELGYPQNIKNAAELLSDVYKQKGNWKEALEMHELYGVMRDSINNASTQKAAIRTQLAYKYEKDKLADSVQFALGQEISALRIAEQEGQLQQEKTQRYALSIGLLLAIVLGGVSYNSYRTKRRDSLKIEEKSKENELLLGEIHHRVKNNLQIVSSLLSLQMKSLEDESAKDAIKVGKERIKSIGVIHTMLYQHDNFSSLEMLDYTKNICNSLIDSFGTEHKKPMLRTDFDPVKLDVDTAIPIGLIISELVINSLKYAYETTAQPELSVSMQEKENQFFLEISDNGSGKAADIEKREAKSFGMRLVRSLTKQLNGTLQITEKNGLMFTMAFSKYNIKA